MRLFWTILKLSIFVSFVLWLASQPGTASIVWHGYQIETSAAFLALCLFGTAFLMLIIHKIWHFIKDGPRLWGLRRELNKVKEGQKYITQGLIALAAGDATEAGRLAIDARKLLGTTTTTRFIQAQAAQMAGDRHVAQEIFLGLAGETESAVLGYRGLIMNAIRDNNWEEAERQVQKLRRLKPETPWLNLIQFEIASRHGQWRLANEALSQASYANLIDPAQAKRHKAAILLATAESEARQGNNDRALQMSEQAVKNAPQWLPAFLALAQLQLTTNHKRAAARTIEKAWGHTPHPQLAFMYTSFESDMDSLKAYKQIERLTHNNEEHPGSQMALAEAALTADLWGEARRNLISMVSKKTATQSTFRLLAHLERREGGDEQAATQWLMKGTEAPPDPRWLCSQCGGSNLKWEPICPHCLTFNSIQWQTPGLSRLENKTLLANNLVGSLS